MVARGDEEQRIIDYLLGEMPEAEKIALEQQFFVDESYFAQLLAVEDELLYDHLRGSLSARESVLFAQRFLSMPEAPAKVQFAKSLLESVAPAPPAQEWSWLMVAAAVAGIGIFVGILWEARENSRLRSELVAERTRHVAPPAVQAPMRASFSLTPGLVRGEEAKILRVPDGAEAAFQLIVPHRPEGSVFRTSLRSVSGVEVWSRSALASPEVIIPRRILTPGDFELILEASGPGGAYREIADYHFSIAK